MIIPDVNLLIYAHNRVDPRHKAAIQWWRNSLVSEEVLLPWIVCHGFIRLTSSRGLLEHPISIKEASAMVEHWLAFPSVEIIHPGPNHLSILTHVAEQTGISGRSTTDLVLAALAVEYDAELHSHDTIFARVQGLKWVNPVLS